MSVPLAEFVRVNETSRFHLLIHGVGVLSHLPVGVGPPCLLNSRFLMA